MVCRCRELVCVLEVRKIQLLCASARPRTLALSAMHVCHRPGQPERADTRRLPCVIVVTFVFPLPIHLSPGLRQTNRRCAINNGLRYVRHRELLISSRPCRTATALLSTLPPLKPYTVSSTCCPSHSGSPDAAAAPRRLLLLSTTIHSDLITYLFNVGKYGCSSSCRVRDLPSLHGVRCCRERDCYYPPSTMRIPERDYLIRASILCYDSQRRPACASASLLSYCLWQVTVASPLPP